MIFSKGNTAKQWIFSELDRRFGNASFRLLDLGCGDAGVWKTFAESHPNMNYEGFDHDAVAIERGKKIFAGFSNMSISSGDAQKNRGEGFDVVTALSAIEHVVNRRAFLQTVSSALKSGGIAFLNYDDGHFRSSDIKERLMVPVSQVMAMFGKEGPYMKHVDDAEFRRMAEQAGLVVLDFRKHNLMKLKGFMRGASDEAVASWIDFEEKLAAVYSPEELDRVMLSSTLVVQKP